MSLDTSRDLSPTRPDIVEFPQALTANLSSQILQSLLNKVTQTNEYQLSVAKQTNNVQQTYHPMPAREVNESDTQYINKILAFGEKKQFVEVKQKYAESNYVAFDCSGPLIRSDDSVFQIIPAEVIGGKWGTHKIFVYPDLKTVLAQKELFIRIDSGCYGGMALEDQTCDCKGQLIKAQDISVERGSGLIVHIPGQDGRGWGHGNKNLNQQIMHELGYSTTKTAEIVYGKDSYDRRDYHEVAIILRALGLSLDTSIILGTNNDLKIQALTDQGFKLGSRAEIMSDTISDVALANLKSKADNWGHKVDA